MTKAEKLQLHRIMENLDCDEKTAKEIMETDKKIDKGEKLFELPEELKAGAKKARQADRKPTVYNFTKRERKQDPEKRYIISMLWDTIANVNIGDTPQITNPEREIEFDYHGRKFKLTLSAPRT